jgi:hypothetical protein
MLSGAGGASSDRVTGGGGHPTLGVVANDAQAVLHGGYADAGPPHPGENRLSRMRPAGDFHASRDGGETTCCQRPMLTRFGRWLWTEKPLNVRRCPRCVALVGDPDK